MTVEASQKGNTYFAPANTVSVTFTVDPTTQIISFSNPGTQTFGVAPITLKATTSSRLAVSYAVTWGPATVSGTILTLTEPGAVTVEATPVGNADYKAAVPVSVTFTVSPGTATYSSGSFGSVEAGAAAGRTHTFSFTIPAATTLGGISALAMGAPDLDCTISGGTCAMEGPENPTGAATNRSFSKPQDTCMFAHGSRDGLGSIAELTATLKLILARVELVLFKRGGQKLASAKSITSVTLAVVEAFRKLGTQLSVNRVAHQNSAALPYPDIDATVRGQQRGESGEEHRCGVR